MSTDIPIIPAPPIDTLTELRRQNSALLQRNVAGAGTTPPSPGELLGFLTAAAKLGRSLEDYETRETAQGIMDFWIANLLSAAPEASEGTRPFTLEPFDECQASADAHEAHQLREEAVEAAQRVETILPAAKEDIALKKVKVSWIHDYVPRCLKPWALRLAGRDSDTAVMERLLMCFVRLKEKSTEAYTVPVTENEAIFSESKAKGILDQLITAGVIKRQEAEGASSFVLAHETLLQKWDFLAEIVAKRRAFRQLARGWDNSGRQRGALISSSMQLQEAIDLPHTDDLEDAFIEASRRSGEKFRRWALVLVSIALVGSSLLVLFLLFAIFGLSLLSQEELEVRTKLQQRAAIAETSLSRIYSLRELLLVGKDDTGKVVKPDEGSGRIKYWDWAGSPASQPVDGHYYPYSLPKEQMISQRTASYLLMLLSKASPAPNQAGQPLMEMFISIGSTDAAYLQAVRIQKALNTEFGFPARFPILRRVVPEKGASTEIRYFYEGQSKKALRKKLTPEQLKNDDPDFKLAQAASAKLQAAGFNVPIKIIAIDDSEAPENFLQISFAVGSLD